MNSLKGHIDEITVNGSMSLVAIDVGAELILKSIVIDTPETVPYLRKGTQINLLFKETEVIIASLENHHVSIQNRIPATVSHVENGVLLTKLDLKSGAGRIVSIISTEAFREMQLKEGDKVLALIKLNEIMLSEC